MKNLLLSLTILLFTTPLWSHSIKFVAMDRYYNKVVPIDSILVHDMNTGEEELFLSDSIFFETISSVEDIISNYKMSIYPNPVEDILNVDLSSSDITISDISGRVHFKSSSVFSRNISLNVAGLAQGIYAIRSGIQSLTFIKNTSSNGQDIGILTSSYVPSPLIKKNEVQSQFDYRFTIYSDGFKPKDYYTKALTNDTVVELDMSTLTSSFDGKHIKVEFSIYSKNRRYAERRDIIEYNYTGTKTYLFTYTDTLVYRNGKIDMQKGSYGGDYPIEPHKINRLRFEIDTSEQTISNLYHFDSYKTEKYSQGILFMNYESFSIHFNKSLKYITENQNRFIINLEGSDTKAGYEREFITVEDNTYEQTEGEEILEFYPKGSYIKIEIID